MKKFKTIFVSALIFILVFSAYKIINSLKNEIKEKDEYIKELLTIPIEEESTLDIEIINEKVLEIGELASLSYNYTDSAYFKDSSTLFGITIPFTTKETIFRYDGQIKCGIDTKDIKIDLNDKTIIVEIPSARILSHEIFHDSVEILNEKNGVFNPIEVEDVNNIFKESKVAMETKITNSDLLKEAQENAKIIIDNLIRRFIDSSYSIEYKLK